MNNETIIGIHQPNYIPWLGFFYKIYKSDIFVFHDDVQFSKKGMHNFHYINTPSGPFRLKIPVKESHGDLINEVVTKDELGWKRSHLKNLKDNYKGSPFFKQVFIDYEEMLSKSYNSLSLMNISMIQSICKRLGIISNYVTASDLKLTSKKEEKVIDIVKTLNGTIYYSGSGARSYQNEENFLSRGIKLKYSNYTPFKYPQLHEPFNYNVTILDFLMNCGYNWDLVLKNQKQE
jgi:hypothetical protein